MPTGPSYTDRVGCLEAEHRRDTMTGIRGRILLLFVLAAVCYVTAIIFGSIRLGFIAFFVVGLVSELVFWILFWRRRRDFQRRRADG